MVLIRQVRDLIGRVAHPRVATCEALFENARAMIRDLDVLIVLPIAEHVWTGGQWPGGACCGGPLQLLSVFDVCYHVCAVYI